MSRTTLFGEQDIAVQVARVAREIIRHSPGVDLAVPVLSHRVRLATHADGFVPTRDEAESAVREIVARIPVPL